MKRALFSMLLCAPWLAGAQGMQCKGQTAQPPAALAELFTSEGCDSCPPADKWLSTQAADARAVPIALHVDYWDYIGWKDRFARADAGARHRRLVNAQGDKVVYTPQLIVNGKTERWNTANLRAVRAPNAAAPVLSLSHGAVSGGAIAVDLKTQGSGIAYVALLEDGLSTEVKAGENRGVNLRHDHVVRALAGPFDLTAAAHAVSLKVPGDARSEKLRVVAWSESVDGKVLGAVAARCEN
jgi:hypothetical protein